MTDKPRAVLFGGNGFLGRYAAQALVEKGYHVCLASRHPVVSVQETKSVESVEANALDAGSVARIVADADVVINFIGILAPAEGQDFDQAHHQAAETIAHACRENHVPCFIHVSAIGADAASPSLYAQSKAAGERAVMLAMPDAVILRPSIVFGAEDSFFNRFAAMARVLPALPLVGGGKTLFQPVYVGDVAAAIIAVIDGRARKGTIYELGGAEQHSFADLLRFICTVTHKRRMLAPLPFPLTRCVGWFMEAANSALRGHIPDIFMITRDQVELLRRDNVVSAAAKAEGRTLQGLGIEPQKISPIVDRYLTV